MGAEPGAACSALDARAAAAADHRMPGMRNRGADPVTRACRHLAAALALLVLLVGCGQKGPLVLPAAKAAPAPASAAAAAPRP